MVVVVLGSQKAKGLLHQLENLLKKRHESCDLYFDNFVAKKRNTCFLLMSLSLRHL